MKSSRLLMAAMLLTVMTPADAADATTVVYRESVDVVLNAIDGSNYADVFMQATIVTTIDSSGVSVVRSTQGIATSCIGQAGCNFYSVNGVRTEQQVSSEPLMNSFSISFDDSGVSVDLLLREPSDFVANCVSAGCVNPNFWYTPGTVHVGPAVSQGYSRGNYTSAQGTILGVPVTGGGAYANASVSVRSSTSAGLP
ncbi:MAG: hypothetical protein ACLGH3_04700 [Actinomycetota bacterium]